MYPRIQHNSEHSLFIVNQTYTIFHIESLKFHRYKYKVVVICLFITLKVPNLTKEMWCWFDSRRKERFRAVHMI